jgi:hypothetical protein
MVTADLIRATLRLIGAISSSETPAADESSDALESLNMMLGSWGASRFLSASTGKVTKTMTGAASYTVGSGGDIDTTRPTAIYNAFWTTGGLDYPLTTLDYYDYERIGIKTVGGIPEYISLKPDNPLSTIYLFPVPASGTLTLENVRPSTELGLDDTLPYPPEWIRAMKFNLAVEISPEFGFTVSPELAMLAQESKAIVMRSMVTVPLAQFDALLPRANKKSGSQTFITGGGF